MDPRVGVVVVDKEPDRLETTFTWRPKYWSDPDESETLRTQLGLIPEGSRVLEVGPAAGHVTRALKRHGCEVTGLEVDAELADLADPLCRPMVVGNIQDLTLHVDLPQEFDLFPCLY